MIATASMMTSNMHLIDWLIVAGMIGLIIAIAVGTRQYMKSVADFLAAGRVAGRYLIAVSEGIAWLGAISIVGGWEAGYKGGFTVMWWHEMHAPIYLIMAITGWIIYRYRETRALTLAQFYEARYNKKFRIFAGFLQWVAGVINMGIFPAVEAKFFMYYCDLPDYISFIGIQWPVFPLLMILLLGSALLLLFFSGQIAVMITDFVQGTFANIVFLIAMVILFLLTFSWSEQIVPTLKSLGTELINPMETGKVEDFNVWFYLILGFSLFYNNMAWQGSQGYNAAARTPHEAKMARIIASWRGIVTTILFAMIPICALVFLNTDNAKFAHHAAEVKNQLSAIQAAEGDYIVDQVRVTLALRRMLPIGVMGAFAAMMFAASVSTLDTYMHSWGSIFIQDVVMPFRDKPRRIWKYFYSMLTAMVLVYLVLFIKQIAANDISPKFVLSFFLLAVCFIFIAAIIHFSLSGDTSSKKHIWAIRLSILFVAFFVFFFSLFYTQREAILLFFQLTGAIVLGGAGSCIIGGLYWKYGKTSAAFSAMIIGAVISLGKIFLDQQKFFVPIRDFTVNNMLWLTNGVNKFVSGVFPQVYDKAGPFEQWTRIPIAGHWMLAIAMGSAIGVYILVSLWGKPTTASIKRSPKAGFITAFFLVIAGLASKGFIDRFSTSQNFPINAWVMLGIFIVLAAASITVFIKIPKHYKNTCFYSILTGVWILFLALMKIQNKWPEIHAGQFNAYSISQITIIAIISGSIITAVLLFLDGRKSYNLDKLLHRGKYSIASDHNKKEQLPPTGLKAIIGITDEFTKWDKFIFYASIIWSMFWVSLFVIFTVYALLPDTKLDVDFWAAFWHFKIWIMFLVGIVVTIWLTVGGIKDSIEMFSILKQSGRDLEDDGVVKSDQDQTGE